jgi:hypothetical protein
MVRARRFKEMGAATGLDDLAELAPVAAMPMLPSAAEFVVAMLPGTGDAAAG